MSFLGRFIDLLLLSSVVYLLFFGFLKLISKYSPCKRRMLVIAFILVLLVMSVLLWMYGGELFRANMPIISALIVVGLPIRYYYYDQGWFK